MWHLVYLSAWKIMVARATRPMTALLKPYTRRAPRVWDQRNFTRLARLEAHSRSRRNVQAISKSSLSIKRESRVGLGEMIVTAHLDRSVARVRHSQEIAARSLFRTISPDAGKISPGIMSAPQSRATPPKTASPPAARNATFPIAAARQQKPKSDASRMKRSSREGETHRIRE